MANNSEGNSIPHFRNFYFKTGELNLLVEDLLRRKSQPDIFPTSSSKQVGDNSSTTPQKSGIGGETSSYISTYFNLPRYLRSCLDYCCFVTERYHVDKEKLVRMLVAEGLIVQDGSGIVMEDMASSIIDELFSIGMLKQDPDLEVVVVPPSYPQLWNENVDWKDFVGEAADSPIRLYILHDGRDNLSSNLNTLQITSLFVFTDGGQEFCDFGRLSRASIGTICKLKSLVVLDLGDEIECLPDEIGDLVHLKYLCLSGSDLKELPRTIGKLQKLQTLDITGSLQELPVEVSDIQQLRHLIMSGGTNHREIRVPSKIGEMKKLQTLRGVYAGGGIAKELSKLTQLRQLQVLSISEDHANELAAAITKMTNLTFLSMKAETTYIQGEKERHSLALFPEMETLSPPPLLEEVNLTGQLIEIPWWLASMQNLTKLCLDSSYLADNPTSEIQFLPNLKHLTLWNAWKAERIGKEFCEVGGFPKLESLEISSDFLVEWTEITNGAFPSLTSLQFTNCIKFRFFPDGLQNISTLQVLDVFIQEEDLKRRLEGKENYKIKNIPNVSLRSFY